MKRFRIKIMSGEHAERYVGGLVANPEIQNDLPIGIPGTNYGSYAQEQGATQFFEHGANEASAKLLALGYEFRISRGQKALNESNRLAAESLVIYKLARWRGIASKSSEAYRSRGAK